MVHRDEYRQMVLAGTVSFPATFPQLGKLTLAHEKLPASDGQEVSFLVVTESPSARVTLVRKVMAKSVRAVFLPNDPQHVHYADGEWLLGEEVVPGLKSRLAGGGQLFGIAFVPENEPSMLNVSVGMTAAESAQYYPPLPNDPAHNHYNAWPAVATSHTRAVVGAAFGSCLPELMSCETELFSCETELEACAFEKCEFEVAACALEDEQCRALAACRTVDEAVELQMQWMQQSLQQSRSLASCNAFPTDM